MEGWYLAGGKKNSISDGTITGQIDAPDRLLPMVPKGFVVVRNVVITADSWSELGNQFQNAVDSDSQHTDSSSTSYGGSVGWCGIGGSVQHTNSDDNGAFTNQHDSGYGWNFERNGDGGTLTMLGGQIVGWIGQIQPASPYRDDPNLPKTADGTTPATNGSSVANPVPAPANG